VKLIFEGKNLGSTKDRAVAWGVHLLTASGVLLAMAAVVSIFHHKPGHALLWLVLAQVVDGLDGPLARKFNVKKHAPVVDGNVLDLVVDYLTCVIVPMAFAARFGIFPAQVEMWIIAAILYVSAIWFAKTDIETKDMWFRGFPTAWNLVVTVFWIMQTNAGIF
jgi:phosphatidylcholine synthase